MENAWDNIFDSPTILAKSSIGVTDAPSEPLPYSNLAMMQNYGLNGAESQSVGMIEDALKVDFNYDYSQVKTSYETDSFWEELSNPVKETGAFVWDSAVGTWDTVKTGVLDAGTSLANVVDSAGTKISDQLGGMFDSLLMRILLIFVILVGGVWLLARAGVIHDVAGVFK